MTPPRRRSHLGAWVTGLTITVGVVVLYLAGALDRIEWWTLDLRFLYANSTPEDPRIACIDIDNAALELVGRWPWPRDVQAGLLTILAEAGAKAILYDVTLVEPEALRTITGRQVDFTLDPQHLDTTGIALALPDQELRLALADAGMVYLAFDYDDPSTRRHQARQRQHRTQQPGQRQLEEQTRAWLDAQPLRWSEPPRALFVKLLAAWETPAAGKPRPTAELLAVVLRDVLGYAATARPGEYPRERVFASPVEAVTPVYFPLARAAKRCGFVVFEPDADNVMRSVRLFVQHEGHVLPELACAVALDELGWQPAEARTRAGARYQVFHDGAQTYAVQVDELGRSLVPWLPETDWTRQFGQHVPIGVIWQVYDRQMAMRHNKRLICDALGEALAAGELTSCRRYHDDLRDRLTLDSKWRTARYVDDAESATECAAWMAAYDQHLAEGEAGLRAALAERLSALSTAPATIANRLSEIQRAIAANDTYAAEIQATLAQLRDRLAGKLCVVGYTATALADMTPIPTSERAPGVVAHANLLNGFLTRRMPGWAPSWLNAALTMMTGGLTTWWSVRRRPWVAGGLAILLATLYVMLAGWVAFHRASYWIALTPAVTGIAVSYLAVLLYRYVFLERESRQLATALGQYTSATLAHKMAEDAELCRRAETREVSVMFTDLRDFTGISERIGAERTQHVLNVCLGRCSEVMLSYEAMINKFIGDGIFAFWNPVIYPQPDHARRACATALDLQAALASLAEEQRQTGGDAVFAELLLRIGVATGPAVVGPCGSEQKYDYTCIGDTVNLAARLESANKFFGTRILVGDATRAQAGPGFLFRLLGSVKVKGKRQAVPIFELLGQLGQVATEPLAYADRFGQAVTAFQQARWDEARAIFEACGQEQPDDLAIARYLAAISAFQTQPPADDWSGTIELRDK